MEVRGTGSGYGVASELRREYARGLHPFHGDKTGTVLNRPLPRPTGKKKSPGDKTRLRELARGTQGVRARVVRLAELTPVSH